MRGAYALGYESAALRALVEDRSISLSRVIDLDLCARKTAFFSGRRRLDRKDGVFSEKTGSFSKKRASISKRRRLFRKDGVKTEKKASFRERRRISGTTA
jgi:hypothetical protein